jgi:hypothetical protein
MGNPAKDFNWNVSMTTAPKPTQGQQPAVGAQKPFVFPSFMTTKPNMRELQQTYRQLPGQFDTSGMEANVNNQMAMNTAQGKASSSVMQRAAMNRAAKMGGAVGASFASGGMMLPIHQANAAMMGDFQNRKLDAAAQMAGLRQNAAVNMAKLRQQQMGMNAGFYGDEMGRQQAGDQFSMSMGQRGREFDDDMKLKWFNARKAANQQDMQMDMMLNAGKQRQGGGLPNWGAYNTMMIAANQGSAPGATAFHQRMQQAANQAGIDDMDVFGTAYI